eukprot:2345953-Pyramimonas_sp.AAC.1
MGACTAHVAWHPVHQQFRFTLHGRGAIFLLLTCSAALRSLTASMARVAFARSSSPLKTNRRG